MRGRLRDGLDDGGEMPLSPFVTFIFMCVCDVGYLLKIVTLVFDVQAFLDF